MREKKSLMTVRERGGARHARFHEWKERTHAIASRELM